MSDKASVNWMLQFISFNQSRICVIPEISHLIYQTVSVYAMALTHKPRTINKYLELFGLQTQLYTALRRLFPVSPVWGRKGDKYECATYWINNKMLKTQWIYSCTLLKKGHYVGPCYSFTHLGLTQLLFLY